MLARTLYIMELGIADVLEVLKVGCAIVKFLLRIIWPQIDSRITLRGLTPKFCVHFVSKAVTSSSKNVQKNQKMARTNFLCLYENGRKIFHTFWTMFQIPSLQSNDQQMQTNLRIMP